MNIINNLSYKKSFFEWGARASMFAGTVFAHEYSHLTTMRSLFTNINPYIGCSISPFNCFAAWNGDPVIRPELSITYETGLGIVSAAGPISDTIGIALSSIIAWKTRNTNKKISLLFASNAFITAFCTFVYSLQAVGSEYMGNDFASIQANLGIPCLIQGIITGSVLFCVIFLINNIFYKTKLNKIQ